MRYKLWYKYKNDSHITPSTLALETEDFCELVDKWNHILQEFQLNEDKLLHVELERLE